MKKLSLVLLLVLIMIGPVIVPGNPVKAATGGYGTVNLAKGKPVTATTNTVRGNPSDVNDGNIDTVWYSFQGNPTNNSFVLDLGAVYSIGRIDIILAQAWGFTVSTSIDGANYTQRHTSPWSPTTVSAPISIAVDGSYSARHIKYAAFANWPQYVGVQEIEVYEWLPSPPPSAPGTYGAVNLALNKPATLQSGFSLVAGNPPSNAVDGNPATTYAGSSSFRDDANGKYSRHGYISIDLGQSYKIGKIVVRPAAAHYYRIVMSNASPYPAGSPWVFRENAAQYGTASTSAEEFTFAINGAHTARYLNVLIGTQATPTSVAPQLGEIEVYEWVAGTGAAPVSPAPAPATPQSKGPVGYWKFDEASGTIARDSSGNGNDGAISGGTWAAGKFGNALNFDGNADFVKLPNTAINGLTDITFTAWIKSNSNKDMGIITGANSATDNEFLLFIEGGTLSTTVKNKTFIGKKKINDGSWHFVAVVRAGNTGEVIVYVDGQQDAKSALTAGKLVIDPNGLWIGRDQDCVGGCWQTEQDFQGSMDEAAIYNRALSQAEIQAAMGGVSTQPAPAPPSAPSQAGLVGYWKFDEGSGATARDSSGNGNDGAISGATWAAGKVGGALSFDGNADSVKLPHTVMNGLVDMTFSAWVKTSDPERATIINGANSTTDNEFRVSQGGALDIGLKRDGFSAGKIVNDGLWHFIAVVRKEASGEVIVYVDGQQEAVNLLAKGKLVIEPNGLWIGRKQECVGGCFYADFDFQGFLDEVRIYNSALSPAEIQTVMAGGTITPPLSTAPPATTTTPSVAPRPTDTTLQAEERTVSPNNKTTVPIRLDKADKLGSLNFSLRYDASVLKVNKAESGDLAGGTLFQANIREAGIIRFGIAAQGTAGITGDGPVAHVEFTALGARGSQSQLTLGDLTATDTSGARLGVTLRSGRVTIAAKLKGDYDGDGKVTAKDALAALKISVNELSEDLNLDMDADGKVTAEDARRILAGALGGPITTSAQPAQPTQPTTSSPATAAGQAPAVLPPLVSKTLEPSASPQLVSYQNKVGVIIPGGTIDSSQTVTISLAPNLQAHPSKGFTQLAAYDISMGNVREFKETLIIEIAYDPSILPPDIRPDKALSVAWWDVGLKLWVNSPFAVDTTRNVIIIPTTHLTVWEAVALVKGWRLEETEHFKIYYDSNDRFNAEGRVGLARILAEEVGLLLEADYKTYQEAGYSMRLTFIPSTGIGAAIGWLAGVGAGAVVGGAAGTVTGGPLAGLWGALAGADVGKNIGAGIGTAAGAILVNSKTYVILDSATVTAEWSKVKLGEIFAPLRHTSMAELRHDLAHELFHAVQNGYFSMAEMGGPIGEAWGINGHWWIEATADYAPVSVGLSKPDALPRIPLDYFKQSLPTEGNEREYVTSRFIEYMVKRRVDFKAMWDDVACLACKERVTTTMLQRIEGYHDRRQPNLHTLFRSWAAEVFFDSNSPLELETGKTLEKSIAVSKDSTLSPADSTVLYDFKLPADYTAQLWRITVGQKDSQTERSLNVMAAALSEQGKVTVNAFVLPNDQRVPGGVATKLIPLYSDGGQTANVTVKKNETLYIMAVNSQTKSVELSVKVTDDAPQAVALEAVIARPSQYLLSASSEPYTAFGTPDNPITVRLSGSVKGDAGLKFEGTESYSMYGGEPNVIAFVYSIPPNATSSTLDFDGLVMPASAEPAKKTVKVLGTKPQSEFSTFTDDATFTWVGWGGNQSSGRPMKMMFKPVGEKPYPQTWTAGKPLNCEGCVVLDANRTGEGTPLEQAGGMMFRIEFQAQRVKQTRDLQDGTLGFPGLSTGQIPGSQAIVIRLVKR